MSHWKQLLAALALTSLVACGGGGGSAGTPVIGGGGSGKVEDVVITFSKSTIDNSGTDQVIATVTAVDANRNGVKAVPLNISVDANALVTPSATSSDAEGKITAVIAIGADKSTRNITVTASSGSVVKTAQLPVVTGTVNPVAADLTLTLSSSRVMNGTSDDITATATAVDANRNVLAGIPITLSVDAGATIVPSGTVTDAKGVVSGVVRTIADRSNRYVTVSARSGNLVREARFLVDGARLFASASPLVTAGSTGNTIEYTLFDSNDKAMDNQAYSVAATGLATQTGKTDVNGKFRYTYSAPATAGNLTITATAAGAVDERVVTVSAAAALPPAKEMPRSATITPTPSVVAVNAANSSDNQVELRALFIGADNRPIQNMRARFDLVGGASETYGVVNVVGNFAYSDVSGVARATFVPLTRESPTNGVTVRVCYDTVDFTTPAPNSCAGAVNFAVSTLTVSKGAISVNIRTNNEIKKGRNELTYIKEYVVMVVDSAGKAVRNAEITPSVDLRGYYKGAYEWIESAQEWQKGYFTGAIDPVTGKPQFQPAVAGSLNASQHYAWNGSAWVYDAAADLICPNEDWNRNGVIENRGGINEDMNGNGELDPRKSDVAVKMIDSTKTDENGLALVQIEYGRSLGSWVEYKILVTASVSGSEARAHYTDRLPVDAAELTAKTPPPSFVVSPYGTASSCTNPN